MEELFYRYNPWWEKTDWLINVFKREKHLKILSKHVSSRDIVFLTGLRRAGKTTLLKLLIQELITNYNVIAQNIFYISLDDYRLSKLSIIEILDEYRKIFKMSFDEKIFVFLDEVAYKNDFELQLKNLYDSQNVKVFASSSSSSILKSKKPFLTGRNVLLEILPLDFDEYLKFKKIDIPKSDSHLIDKFFEEYLQTGGLPEYVLRGDIDYLRELVDDIIRKDIASKFNIKNTQILQDFFLLLMERAGKTLSINKAAKILSVSPDSTKRYLSMFADCYLVYLLPRHGKTNEIVLSPKKIYAPDLGIRTLFTGFRDKGSLFENYVYLNIKDTKPGYIIQDGIELDFMTKNKYLLEVKYNSELTPKQKSLYESTAAEKKFMIKSYKDFVRFLPEINTNIL